MDSTTYLKVWYLTQMFVAHYPAERGQCHQGIPLKGCTWSATMFRQIINAILVALVFIPQLYVLTRPKSSRFCEQPLLNNLTAFIVLSFMATGFTVTFTLIDPVPQSFRAAYHAFGLVSFSQGLCTIVMTLTAQQCVKTTPELYYLSSVLSLACIMSTAFFLVKGGLWVTTQRLPLHNIRGNNI